MITAKFVSVLFFTIVCVNLKSVNSERHEATLDPEGKYVVGWSVSGDRITFDVAVEGKGWVGLGISESPDMYEADIFIGIVFNNGTATVGDYFGQGPFRPSVDDSQDVSLLYGYESETHTYMRYSRLLDTGDAIEDRVISDSLIYLIYAIGPSDDLNYHGPFRGGYSVNLLNPTM